MNDKALVKACLICAVVLSGLGMGSAAWAQEGRAGAAGPYRPETLELTQIRSAIQRGVAALYRMEPEYTFRDEHALMNVGRSGPHYQEVWHEMGNHALASWALLACGESYQNPPLYKRINWVLSGDQPFTFDRGMRAQMLAELPHDRWGAWVRRDALWLTGAVTAYEDPKKPESGGNYTDEWAGAPVKGFGDHANGQYGVLGLWGCERSGFGIETKYWKAIDLHWRSSQQKTEGNLPAGWSVGNPEKKEAGLFYTRVSGPMTAGGVSTLSLTERYLYGRTMATRDDFWQKNPQLPKGIAWLDQNFTLDDAAEESDWFFYMWTIQRVGHVTGYRTFNSVDWYRTVTARMLNLQQSDGSWTGSKGRLLSTGFALLYLSKAYDPLAVSKVRFLRAKQGQAPDESWNNRPHDMINFVDYISDQYEYATTWQIIELSQPAYVLIESPILYLSTDKPFTLSEQEIANLREYIEAGGILVLNAEATTGDLTTSFAALVEKLTPGKKLERVPREHALVNIHKPLNAANMLWVHNGIRPQIISFPRDIGQGLQSGDFGKNEESFAALSNIYLYATGMNPRRARLENNYSVSKPGSTGGISLGVARIRYSGTFDPEPGALKQLKAIMGNEHNVDLKIASVSPDQLSSAHKIAFLTTIGDGSLSDAEATAIRRWGEDGGTLWVDGAGGSQDATKGAFEMMAKIVPSASAAPLALDHRIISGEGLRGGTNNRRVKYRFYALKTMGPVATPRLQTVEINNRPAIVYSSEDLTCGLAGLDHWNIFGYTPESSRRLVVNGILSLVQR